jgi:glutamine phosphoribosylpyrophosphate amidotransferase
MPDDERCECLSCHLFRCAVDHIRDNTAKGSHERNLGEIMMHIGALGAKFVVSSNGSDADKEKLRTAMIRGAARAEESLDEMVAEARAEGILGEVAGHG